MVPAKPHRPLGARALLGFIGIVGCVVGLVTGGAPRYVLNFLSHQQTKEMGIATCEEARKVLVGLGALDFTDLNAASIRFYEALGRTRAPLAFNDDGRDATHHDNYGAWVLAHIVADAARRQVPALARLVRRDLTPLDPSQPPAPEAFRLAASGAHSTQRPAGN